jgi:DNA polymerase III epsilon subunit family exonuclease
MALPRRGFQLKPVASGPCELAQREFAVLDLETTGGKPEEERIIEIAAIVLRDGNITRTFSQLVDPMRGIPPFITRLTGITAEMVSGRPAIDTVLPRFLDFAGDSILVAHHADFDISFLNTAAKQLGLELSNDVLCTRRLGKQVLPWLPSHSLSTLADFFGIGIRHRHRAFGDAEATVRILDILLRYVMRRGIRTLDELHLLERGLISLF